MKLDIKSFLIGILTTVNLFLLMGFDDHKKEIGRYQGIRPDDSTDFYVMDTTNGEFVKNIHWKKAKKEVEGNPNKLD